MRIRPATRQDAEAISHLLTKLSEKFIAPAFNEEGQTNLLSSMTTAAVEGFFDQDFRYHVGLVDDEIMGVVGTRDNSHLFHLFVDDQFHGLGYASELWSAGREACLESGENPGYFTVNASLNAQNVYLNWGFKPIDGIREGGGVKDVPMKMELALDP